MTRRTPQDWILKVHEMLLIIDLIEGYLRDHTVETFVLDHKAINTVCYNLRLLGEGAYKVPREIRTRFPEIPWVQLRNLRNPIAVDHFRHNPRILWTTCSNRVLDTSSDFAAILRQEQAVFEPELEP